MTKHGVHDSRSIFGLVVLSLAGLGVSVGACSAEHAGQLAPGFAGAGGSGGDAGRGGVGGDRGGASGANGGGTSDGGGPGGSGPAGAAGDDGQDAEPPSDGGQPGASCIFHTERPVDAGAYVDAIAAAEGGASEAGPGADIDAADAAEGGGRTDAGIGSEGGPRVDAGDAGAGPSITTLVSPFLGPYLADAFGRTLYTYGGDLAGDCKYAPISTCELDCAIAWPIFDAGTRTLAPGLDDAAFGTIQRADGTFQTTYFGWPLYYYKSDTAPGMFTGQAKAKTWHAATVIPVGVMLMKDSAAVKYLADGAGKTLYSFDQDTKGTATSDPVSSCSGSCLGEHPVFQRNRLSVVSSLVPTDFTLFVRSVGGQQLAYKGAPLYYGAVDERSGDRNGATMPGWSVAVP
jgi:predicted lipoprotein with Yx(FWY)xxD motif